MLMMLLFSLVLLMMLLFQLRVVDDVVVPAVVDDVMLFQPRVVDDVVVLASCY
jgi:hypothetical protein